MRIPDEASCTIDPQEAPVTVESLSEEILTIWEAHPAMMAYSHMHDAGKVDRQSPLFAYAMSLNEAFDKAKQIPREVQAGEMTEAVAIRMLESRKRMLRQPPPDDVSKLIGQWYAARANSDDRELAYQLMDMYFAEIERIVANNNRLAMYGEAQAVDDGQALLAGSPLRMYLYLLDTMVADAEQVRYEVREGGKSAIQGVMELLSIRDTVLHDQLPELQWQPAAKRKKSPPKKRFIAREGYEPPAKKPEPTLKEIRDEKVFDLYDEIASITEFSEPSMQVRSGNADPDLAEAAQYLDNAFQTALRIRDMYRNHQLEQNIAIRTLTKLLAQVQKVVPGAKSALSELPGVEKVPSLSSPDVLQALEAFEGPEWVVQQNADRNNPRGFWLNYNAFRVLKSMGDDAVGLRINHLDPKAGIIEGNKYDYIVGSNGRLTALPARRS